MQKKIVLVGCGSRLVAVSQRLKRLNFGLKVFEYVSENKGFEDEIYEDLAGYKQTSLIFFCNYPKRLKRKWNTFQSFILHGGHVPQYRGASVINWQILNGEPYIGLTILRFSKNFDQGNIILTGSVSTNGIRTLDDIRKEIDEKFAELCVEVITKRLYKLIGEAQLGEGTYWHKRSQEHMEFNPKMHSYDYLKRLYRSSECHYRPFILKKNKKIFIKELKPDLTETICGYPGHILTLNGKTYLILKEGSVEIVV